MRDNNAEVLLELDSASLYKIGKYYVFDTNSCIGYKVIRDTKDLVVGFQKAFEIHLEDEVYKTEAYEQIPAGIVRKAVMLLSAG